MFKKSFVVGCLAVCFFSSALASSTQNLKGRLHFSADLPSFKSLTLAVEVFERDVRVADRRAKRIGTFQKSAINHQQGQPSTVDFVVPLSFERAAQKRVFATFFLRDAAGHETHIGECGEPNALCYLFEEKTQQAVAVKMRLITP